MEKMHFTINGKKYTVEYVFNMVGNYHFIEKHGTRYLVDAEDVWEWVGNVSGYCCGLHAAVDYAKELASMNEGGAFWWKEIPAKK